MRFRTLTGILMFAALGLVIAVDVLAFEERPLGCLLMLAMAEIGWLELSRMTGIRGTGPKGHRGLFFLGAAGIGFFFAIAWLGARFPLPGGVDAWALGGLGAVALCAFGLVVLRADFEAFYLPVLETLVGVVLLGLLLSYYPRIYLLHGWRGPILWAVLVAGVKGNDSAAYYVGKTWGRHPLSPVSPKKTREGSLGAILFSVLYFGAAAALLTRFLPESHFPWYGGMLFGMIISVASQAGDLAESLIKRTYKVKDSAAILPEFGGVLDMVDSLVFTGVLSWWIP